MEMVPILYDCIVNKETRQTGHAIIRSFINNVRF